MNGHTGVMNRTRTTDPIFIALRSLHDEHDALLKRFRAGQTDSTFKADVRGFLQRCQDSGVLLKSEDERFDVQNVITYWSNVLYRLDGQPTDFELAEFDASQAPDLPQDACPYSDVTAFMAAEFVEASTPHRLVTECLERLESRHLAVIVGATGSGRSAFVDLALMPTLRSGRGSSGGEAWAPLKVMSPGAEPLRRLLQTIAPQHAADQETFEREVQRCLADADTAATLLSESGGRRRVLCIDNFDELFTECPDERQRKAFADNLYGLVRESSNGDAVIAVLRREFLSRMSRLGAFGADALDAQVPFALSPDELRRAIVTPAEGVGLKFDEGLVDRLVLDIYAEPAALALLQFTMRRLWEKKDRNRITWDAYHEVGAGSVALERAADEFFAEWKEDSDGAEAVRKIMMVLVRPSGSRDFVTSRVTRAALRRACPDNDRLERVLRGLLSARLVRQFDGPTSEQDTFALAHPALVEHWPLLVEWLEDERLKCKERLRLTVAAEQWDDCREDPRVASGVLWGGGRLDEALKYDDLSPVERAFLDASRAAADRRDRNWRWIAAALGALTITAVVAAIFSLHQRGIAERERNTAIGETQKARDAEELATGQMYWAEQSKYAALSESDLRNGLDTFSSGDLLSSLAWFRDAMYWDQEAFKYTYAALHPALARDPLNLQLSDTQRDRVHRVRIGTTLEQVPRLGLDLFQPDDLQIVYVDLSPDGLKLATASGFSLDGDALPEGAVPKGAGSAEIWHATTGKLLHVLPHDNQVSRAVFSPNGLQVLTACLDGTARLWDATTGQALSSLPHDGPVNWAAFNHDGTRVLTVSARSGTPSATAAAWTGTSAEESTAATAGFEAVVWDPAKTSRLFAVKHIAAITHAEFNARGDQIVTSSEDRTACVWDARDRSDGDRLKFQMTHTTPVTWAAFSPIGSMIAVACQDGTVRVLDPERKDSSKGNVLLDVRHDEAAVAVQFSPNGQFVVSASDDATARVWPVVDAKATPDHPAITQPLAQFRHGSRVHFAKFSPDGQFVVTASRDRTSRVWDVQSGKPVTPPLRHRGGVTYATFGPEGVRVLTCSGRIGVEEGNRIADGGEVRIWFLNSRRPTFPAVAYNGQLVCACFSPDQERLAIGGSGSSPRSPGFAQVWDVRGGFPLSDHLVHDLTVRSVAFDSTGERLVTAGDDGAARVWEADTGHEIPLQHSIRHDAPLNWAGFSPDGAYILTASLDGTARMWRSASGQPQFPKPIEHAQGVLSGAFSPDGRHFATASADDSARIYEISTDGQQPNLSATILFHTADVTHVGFSQWDGKYLVTSSVDQTARVWDLQGQAVTPAINHERALSSASFSPDNQILATVTRDRTVWLWDLSAHLTSDDDFETDESRTNLPVQLTAPPLLHRGQVRTAAFGDDGRTLMTGADGHAMQVASWYLPEVPLDRGQLAQYAVVLTGQDPKEPGTFTPVDREDLTSAWEASQEQSGYEALFGLDGTILSKSIEEWHLQQVARAELVGAPDTAVGHLNELLLTDPQNASLLGRRAQAYFSWARQAQHDRSKLQHALQDYLAASQIDADNPANYSYFERRGEIHRAYANQVVLNGSPADPPASDLWSAAVGDFTRAIELHPDRWWPYYMRGRTYAELLDWEHARADFDQATKLGARQDYVWYFLAMISLLQENEPAYHETVSAMTKVFNDTKSPQIANIVIWTSTLGEHTLQQPDMMNVLADAARKLGLSDRSFYLNTVAAATFRAAEQLQRSGDSAEALVLYKKAQQLFEESNHVRSSENATIANAGMPIGPVGMLQGALIYHALEQDNLAQGWLRMAEEWSTQVEQGDQSATWTERAEFQILYREATRKIRSDP